MRTIQVSALIEDRDLYPRQQVDGENVRRMVETLESGGTFPPVVVEKQTLRIVDGVHRCRALLQLKGVEVETEVIEKTYKNDSEMFLDSMRLNATHGKNLEDADRSHCLVIAERLSIPDDSIAGALSMPTRGLGVLRLQKVMSNPREASLTVSRSWRRDGPVTNPESTHVRRTPAQCSEEETVALTSLSADKLIEKLILLFEKDAVDLAVPGIKRQIAKLHLLLEKAL